MPNVSGDDKPIAILIEGLVKSFGQQRALANFNAEFRQGQLTGLVGPDGAGKTTLIRLMAGLMMPTSGKISIMGLDTREDTARIPDIIGYMPQRFGLYEDLTIQENLTLYAELQNLRIEDREATFNRLLSFTRLSAFTDRLAGNLSGGMKQKLGLACAMISSPKVLLLDEPGVGVDPVSRQDLWRMVGALTIEGVAVVWATAYLEEAEKCDRVILLNEGEIAFEGKPASLTKKLEQRTYLLEGVANDRRRILGEALKIRGVCDGVIQGSAIRLVVREGADIAPVQDLALGTRARLLRTSPRFEDGFVDLLGGGPGGVSELAERMKSVSLPDTDAVQCRNLTKRFGHFTATDRVTFSVRRGEIFGLLGPNGAGKSTTFKMLCGLLKSTEGEALVASLNLRTATSEAKSRLGYMAQKFSLYGLLSVRQNLEFSAGVYGLDGTEKQDKIREMIDIFNLERYLDAEPDALPLGYKQRLALACAVMHNPPVLFLDEPTSGVDPITRREFWTHINGMVQKGVTVLVTTHFMDEAEYCDRVALMYQARVIALDTPDKLKSMAQRGATQTPSMEEAFIRLIEDFDRKIPSGDAK